MARYPGWEHMSEADIKERRARIHPDLHPTAGPHGHRQPVVPTKPKGNKYHAIPTGGHGSRKESRHAQELRLREYAGEITELCLDKRLLRYALVVNGVYLGYYEADGAGEKYTRGK